MYKKDALANGYTGGINNNRRLIAKYTEMRNNIDPCQRRDIDPGNVHAASCALFFHVKFQQTD